MAVKVTGQFVPAGEFSIVDGKDISGNITGSNFSGSSSSTGSFGNLNISSDASITGDMVVGGKLTAQEIHTEIESASIIFTSGSTKFGDTSDDIHRFTGSLKVTGSITATTLSGDGSGLTNVFENTAASSSISSRLTNLVSDSASFSTRISTAETELEETLVSASAQLADQISGSFTAPSASLSTRVTNLKSDSGSFSTRVTDLKSDSGSFSTRVTDLKTDSASFSSRITTAETELELTLISGSAQIATQISGAFDSVSSSLSSRLQIAETELENTLVSASAQLSDQISGSFTAPSSSFSTRVTKNEGTGSKILTGQLDFTNITATGAITASGGLQATTGHIKTQNSRKLQAFRNSGQYIELYSDPNGFNYLQPFGGALRFAPNGGTKMILHTNGRLGLNTTTDAGFLLDINGTSRLTGDVTLGADISGSATSTGSFGHGNFDGNVGIGTKSPSKKLEVFKESEPRIRVTSGNSGNPAYEWAVNNDRKWVFYSAQHLGTNTMYFKTNTTNIMALKQDGDVGIGNDNPSFKLDVGGTGRFTGTLTTAAITTTGITSTGNISGSLVSTGSFGSIKFDNELVGSSNSTGSFGRITTQGAINIGVNAVIGQGLSIGGDTIANGNITAPSFTGIFNGALSGSAQIASNISGAFAVASASFASDINDLQADSGSFSTRVTNLKSDSGSFSTRVTDLKLDSGSFSTRVTNLKIDSGSLATRITNLKADSGSFSTRVTKNEGTGSKILNGQLEFTNITGSGHISMSILSTGSFGRVSATTIGGHSPLVVDSNTTFIHSITSSAHVSSSMTSTASFGRVNVIGLGGHQTLTIDPITTFTNVITASANVNFDSKIFIQTGSIEGDLHVRTNADLMRIGKSTTGLLVSGSGEIQRFATASNGDLIDLGFTVIDEDGNSVLAGDGDGIHVDDNNYWYNNKFYKVGNGSTKFLEYDAIDLKYKGQVFATTGSIDGEMYIKSPTGSMFIGKYTGGIPSSGSSTNIPRFATGSDGSIIDLGFTTTDEDGNTVFLTTGDGIVVDSNNYWYTTGHFKIGNSKNFINWNTSNLTISGTFVGDGSGLTGVSGGGGSSFTKAGISGSFTVLSSSFSSRLTTAEAELSLTLLSSSAQVKSLLPTNVVSSSKQIASNISGSITQVSGALSTRLTNLEGNAVFTSAGISGSTTVLSSSLASRIKTLEAGGVTIPTNTVSSSAQLASRISGSFTALSASLAGRITSGGGGGSDNLGNHTATQNLNLDNNAIINASNVSGSSTSTGSFAKAHITDKIAIGHTNPISPLHTQVGSVSYSHHYTYQDKGITIEADEPMLQLIANDNNTHGGSILMRYGDNVFAAVANTSADDLEFNYAVTSGGGFIMHGNGSNVTSYKKIMTLNKGGNITIGGNISGSSTSTGSFGLILQNGSELSTFQGAAGTETLFSGSAASTGSFGRVDANRVNATDATFANEITLNDGLSAPGVGADIHLGDGLGTTPKIRFGSSSWKNNYGLESYYSVFSTNSNEGYIFKDSGNNELFRLYGATNGTTSLRKQAHFIADVVFLGANAKISGSATSTGSFGSVVAGGTGTNTFTSKVGIGTTTVGTAAGSLLTLENSGASYTQYSVGSSGGGAVGSEGVNLVFYTYVGALGAESYAKRMTLNSGGNFSIGNTNNTYKLDVSGTGRFTDTLTTTAINASGNISGSATSTGSFGHIIGDGSGITNVTSTVPTGTVSGSAQIIAGLPSGVVSGSSGNLTVTNTITATTGSISNIQTPLTGRVISNFTELIKVTVVSDGGNHYAFEGATAPSIQVSEGKTYRFDLSDGTLGPHPFRLSTTEDGSHNGGSSYTTGVTIVGSAGSAGAYLEIKVDKNTANALYYYCTAHPGMGNDGRLLKNDLMNLAAIKVTGNQVDFTNLPTSNPNVAGRLWNDSGTVKISSG